MIAGICKRWDSGLGKDKKNVDDLLNSFFKKIYRAEIAHISLQPKLPLF